ncbi:MAG TPA: glycosyltransferase [Nitriliruptorales bacterium]
MTDPAADSATTAAPGGPPNVSVIIPARDAANTIVAAIESVLAQHPAPAQVVVAVPPDDAGTRAALAAVNTGGTAQGGGTVLLVVDNPSGGTPDGLNAGLAKASGEIVARVDAHAVLPPGYLAVAIDGLARDEHIGNIGGIQRPVGTDEGSRAIAAAMRSPLGSGGATYRSGRRSGPVDTVYLGVFRAAALRAVGGWDRRFTRNQDYELNVRLWGAGWRVWFDPAMVVDYRPRGDLASLARQYRDYGRWRRATMRLHPGSARLRQLALPLAAAGFLMATAVATLVGASWVGPVLLAAYAAGLLVAAVLDDDDEANALLVVAALATMHASWTIGFALGPPSGWNDAP